MNTKDELIVKRFGETAARIRNEKGLSLRQVAARCELAHSTISAIETGQLNVTLLTMIQLSKGLDVPASKLLEFKY
jgi:transcriptional regulator with XRE-family HTH domain